MLRELLIRAMTSVSWRLSTRRLARSLHQFSQVEADSAWQMVRALQRTDDAALRAKLFNNALEEVQHAALFGSLTRAYMSMPPPYSAARRIQLFDEGTGMVAFEAYHFVGEADVYRDFAAYGKAAPTPLVRDTFDRIRGDEDEHQHLAFGELLALAGSRQEATRLIRRVRRRRLYESWVRVGQVIGDGVAAVVLGTLYLISLPAFVLPSRRRLGV